MKLNKLGISILSLLAYIAERDVVFSYRDSLG